jgi:hypothetical protein
MLDKDPSTRSTIARMQQCPWVTDQGNWCAQLEMASMAAQGVTGADYKLKPPVCETLCPNDIQRALGASKQRPLDQLLPPQSIDRADAPVAASSVPSDVGSFTQKLRARLVSWKKELTRKCDANKAAKAKKRATLTDFKAQLAAASAKLATKEPNKAGHNADDKLYDDAPPVAVQ